MKLGAIYYEEKQWDKAAEAFGRVLALEPSNLRARYFLATTYMDAGKEAQAQEELQKILHADPQSVDARVQLGFLYSRLKRLDEAIALLKEAVNLEPRRPELFLYLGTAYYRAQQYDREMHPVWDRKFEPPAITGLESQDALETLLLLARKTGDRKYLDAALSHDEPPASTHVAPRVRLLGLQAMGRVCGVCWDGADAHSKPAWWSGPVAPGE